MWKIIITFLSGSGILILIFYGSVWLLKKTLDKLLEKELDKAKNNLAKELESYKRELDLVYEHKLSLQDRRRKLYEEFSNKLEEIFSQLTHEVSNDSEKEEFSFILNKMFGRLALYAPDEVYVSIKQSLDGKVVPNEAKPIIYCALRKSLFGDETKLTQDDLAKHIDAKRAKTQ